jgi:hypothetical protein
MTYNDVVRRVYDILAIPEKEAKRVGYANAIPRALNEAMFRIAHSVLPNLREYTVKLTRDKLPARVEMPPDFISFADEQDAYLNGKNFIITNFIGSHGIIVSGDEVNPGGSILRQPLDSGTCEYTFFYNALYPRIVDDGNNFEIYKFNTGSDIEENQDNYTKELWPTDNSQENAIYDIPDIVGSIAPHYVVSQILTLDDKVRSITELNQFETLLAAVDTHRNERQRQYHSVRGWY